MESEEMALIIFFFQGSNGETDIDNRLMDKVGGEEGEGEMYGTEYHRNLQYHI